jgi:hypothetical protein
MGDFGHDRCGVGASAAALADRVGEVVVLDTAAPGVVAFASKAFAAARTGAPCAGVYPTRSTVYQPQLLIRALALRVAFGRRRFRLHLHEFKRLRRMLRWPVELALLLPGVVVVSSESERAAVRGALRGLVGRLVEVRVAAPTNGAAPTTAEVELAAQPGPDAPRTVGVFGAYRPDKGAAWLEEVLERLDARFDRLVVGGAGWEEHRWAPAVADRYAIELMGHVPRDGLPAMFASWGLAIAPLWAPAHDGRMSLRTPLAYGVPTLTVGPRDGDLTLEASHLLVVPPAAVDVLDLGGHDRRHAAAQVARYEEVAADRLAEALFGG